MNPSKEMVKLAVKALEDKKGEDIKIIDIQNVWFWPDTYYRRRSKSKSGTGNGRQCGGRAL